MFVLYYMVRAVKFGLAAILCLQVINLRVKSNKQVSIVLHRATECKQNPYHVLLVTLVNL